MKRQAQELADDADLRATVPKETRAAVVEARTRTRTGQPAGDRDPRLPPLGSDIARDNKC